LLLGNNISEKPYYNSNINSSLCHRIPVKGKKVFPFSGFV